MNPEEAKNMQSLISQSDATDLQALLTAKENSKRNMLDEPSAANIAAFEKAKRAMELFLRGPDTADQLVFAKRKDALEYLKKQGFKIGKSKFYGDCKKGRCKLQDDGKILEKDLMRYVKSACLVRLSTLEDKGRSGISELRQQKELEKLEEDILAKRRRREVDEGNWIPRSAFELELAARAAIFEAGQRHMLHSRVGEWCSLLKGDPSAIPLVLEDMEKSLNRQLTDYADLRRFQVLFTGEA
jgi:hypothetical protein